MAHTIILKKVAGGFHCRNHGFLFTGIAVSRLPDRGVMEAGILTLGKTYQKYLFPSLFELKRTL